MATPGTFTPKRLVTPGYLGTASAGTLYTAPGAGAQITSFKMVNIGTTAFAFHLWMAPAGVTHDNSHYLVKEFILASDGVPVELVANGEQWYMGSIDQIRGSAQSGSVYSGSLVPSPGSAIVYHISGVEFQ